MKNPLYKALIGNPEKIVVHPVDSLELTTGCYSESLSVFGLAAEINVGKLFLRTLEKV